MTRMRLMLNMFAVSVICLMCASIAQAQATRTWVSGVGDDANPCSRTAPCKTFAGAISKTAAGGEINALDPGGYGAITITKAITIDGGGTFASILSSLVNGVVVNAGANDVVTIRNIAINGAGNGVNGIRFLAGKQLNVENVTMAGFTSNGIDVSLPASTTSALTVKNTTITGLANGAVGNIGIRITATSGTPTVSIDNTRLQGLATGLDVLRGIATISNSVISNNSNFGIIAENVGVINVDTCEISSNTTGVQAQVGTTVRLSNNGIYNNTTSIGNGGGTVASDGTNRNSNPNAGVPNAAVTRQ